MRAQWWRGAEQGQGGGGWVDSGAHEIVDAPPPSSTEGTLTKTLTKDLTKNPTKILTKT